MNNIQGKKILVITGATEEVAIVESAKKMGLYVVCCDGITDWKYSPAKIIADEAWDINYNNTEEIVEKCRIIGIDGVIAGYSEFRVLAAARIAKAIGTPFYATEEQIDITRNKKKFKELCVLHNVPVPHDYSYVLNDKSKMNEIKYPVIVKPSDRGGRKGISICNDENELESAVAFALSESINGEVVIEEYIKGIELASVYTISDGRISLSCLNDKYTCDSDKLSMLCNLVMTPSKHYMDYINEVDTGMKALLADIGVKNGVASVQCIVNGSGVKVFEISLRLNGNNDYTIIRKNNNIDYMKMMINYSITGSMGDDLDKDNPLFNKKYCTLVIHLKTGIIRMFDYNRIKDKEGIESVELLKEPGSKVQLDGTNNSKSMMIKMSGTTTQEITELLNYAQENIDVYDVDGNSMLIDRFRTERLLE